MSSKSKTKTYLKATLLFGVAIATLNSCLPWNTIYPTCIPISNDIGMWSQYKYSSPSLIELMVPEGLSGYDHSDRSSLYMLSNDVIEENAPHLLGVRTDFNQKSEVFGIIWSKEHNVVHESHQIRYIPEIDYLKKENDMYWSRGLGIYDNNIFVHIGKPDDYGEKWARHIGRCDNFPEEDKDWHSDIEKNIYEAPGTCKFDLHWKSVLIEYDIFVREAHRYKEVEEFLKSQLLCELDA